MKTFEIEIKETLSQIIEVKANSEYEAFAIVKQMYRDEKIVLDSSDYVDTEYIRSDNS